MTDVLPLTWLGRSGMTKYDLQNFLDLLTGYLPLNFAFFKQHYWLFLYTFSDVNAKCEYFFDTFMIIVDTAFSMK